MTGVRRVARPGGARSATVRAAAPRRRRSGTTRPPVRPAGDHEHARVPRPCAVPSASLPADEDEALSRWERASSRSGWDQLCAFCPT
jgi:hypothetical protein